MLHQLDIYLENADLSEVYSELAIKIHGFLMCKIDKVFAGKLHEQGVNPFSIFAVPSAGGFIVRLSALTDEALQLIDVLEKERRIIVKGAQEPLKIIKAERAPSIGFDEIQQLFHKRKYKITFVTPAMYKSQGVLCFDTRLENYFNSVIQKMNLFENTSFTMEDVHEALGRTTISDYSFSSANYFLSGHNVKGMTGEAFITIKSNGMLLNFTNTLLGYSVYSGVGGKTPLGMGGFLLEEV